MCVEEKKNVLKMILEEFGHIKIPTRMTPLIEYEDKERKQIERHFQGMHRDMMSSYDVSMMLIDSALILPKSLLHYLPRLVNDVFYKGADIYFLNYIIGDLMKIESLTYSQQQALLQLKSLVLYLEKKFDEEGEIL
ncbi:MAG: hypothetical protein CR997_13920 [Acidobacteria bacterium]|nr:MAG: hypothetical protein CR997_13920 [Acidobacteriota bacterium]